MTRYFGDSMGHYLPQRLSPTSNITKDQLIVYVTHTLILEKSKQNHNPTRETVIMHLKTLILNLLPRPIDRSWGPFDHY
jgi:hypothetical protein